MSVRQVAEELGRPASTYASYEDKFKKPFLPVDLVTALVPVFERRGIKPEDVWALAGIGKGSISPTAPNPEQTTSNLPNSGQELLTETVINIHQFPRDIPILGSGSCGEDGLFELNGQIHGYAKRPPRLMNVKGAYAVYIHGLSMWPWRKPGQLAFVDPYQPPNIGDFVVVQLKAVSDGQHIAAYIKQLARRTARELRLHQFNPEEDLTIAATKVLSVHRVIDWDELLGL